MDPLQLGLVSSGVSLIVYSVKMGLTSISLTFVMMVLFVSTQQSQVTGQRPIVGIGIAPWDRDRYHQPEPQPHKRFIPSPSSIAKIVGRSLDKIFLKHLEVLDYVLNSDVLTQFVPGEGPLVPIPKLSLLPDLGILRQLFRSGHESVKSAAVCNACRIGFTYFLIKARTGILFNEVKRLVILTCSIFRIASPEVCKGLADNYTPILYHLGNEKSGLTPDTFCGIALQSFGCIAKDWKSHDWNIASAITEYPDAPVPRYEYLSDSQALLTAETLPGFKIVHLADLHVDPAYVPGSNAICREPLCCRATNGPAKADEAGAGLFGDLRNCDLPFSTLEAALRHIATVHPDVNLVYMTGDLIPHNVWSTSIDTNKDIIRNVTTLLKAYFPGIQVVPVLGNHESHPANVFAPLEVQGGLSTRWLYEFTSEIWAGWIPQGQMKTFKRAGFYSLELTPNFRVVVLNTNLCYGANFWQFLDFKDPAGQLMWLADVLQEARVKGQKVHIVGHISPGQEDCTSTWSQSFYNIINKFSDIITSQFYGHTHYDEFQLFYHKDNPGVPISAAWFGPGLSSFTEMNPCYKIYTVDGARGTEDSTWHVLDAETWILNLTQANMEKDATGWYRLYKATEEFEVPNLLPDSVDQIVQSLSTNRTMFDKFYYKDTPESTGKECNQNCKKRLLCNIVTPFYERQVECLEIESEVDGIVLPKRIFEKLRTVVVGPIVKVVNKFSSIIG